MRVHRFPRAHERAMKVDYRVDSAARPVARLALTDGEIDAGATACKVEACVAMARAGFPK